MPFDMLPQEPAEPSTVKNLRTLRTVIQESSLVDLNEWCTCLGGHAERVFDVHGQTALRKHLGVNSMFFAGSQWHPFYLSGYGHHTGQVAEALNRIARAINTQLNRAKKKREKQLDLPLLQQLVA